MVSEEFPIDSVHGREVVHVFNEHQRLNHFPQLAPSSLDDSLEVTQSLLRLRLDTPRHDLYSFRVERDAPRNEKEAPGLECLGVWAYGGRCVFC